MRPTISEQLAGASRLLEQFIAPELSDRYAAALLANIIDDLRMLEASWADVLPFLHWDSTATAALLAEARPDTRPPLRDTIDALTAETPGVAVLDFAAAQAHNDRLRQAIVDYLAHDESAQPALRDRITAHLVERAARYPLRMSLALPAARTAEA
jgi:hypothetical protein